MTAQFLRDEAARFRGMADDADRTATKQRLLAMAVDYETRADIADETTGPTGSNLSETNPEVTEPKADETIKVKPGRMSAKGLKDTVVVERRPVGRPRRE